MTFLIKGLILGFTMALAIGPIAILCINRGLARGFWSGFISGLGAASADAVYGAVAAFGLTFISSFLVEQKIWLQVIGIAFLIYLGVNIFISNPQEKNLEKSQSNNLFSNYLSIFFLTLTNPMTILSFTAVFAGLGLTEKAGDYGTASMLVLGFFLGSALLYLLLSVAVSFFRKKITANTLVLVNKISGLIIIGFAIVILTSLIKCLGVV